MWSGFPWHFVDNLAILLLRVSKLWTKRVISGEIMKPTPANSLAAFPSNGFVISLEKTNQKPSCSWIPEWLRWVSWIHMMSMFKFSLSVIFSPWMLQEASRRLRAYGNFSESLSTEVLKKRFSSGETTCCCFCSSLSLRRLFWKIIWGLNEDWLVWLVLALPEWLKK